jgi:AAA+ ATPase superfamily predicted ATPase
LLPFKFSEIGTWWEKEREIDIVAFNREEKKILFCEVKWQDLSKKEAEEILENLKDKAKMVKWFYEKRKEYFCLIGKNVENKEDLRGKGCLVFDLEDFLKKLKLLKTVSMKHLKET